MADKADDSVVLEVSHRAGSVTHRYHEIRPLQLWDNSSLKQRTKPLPGLVDEDASKPHNLHYKIKLIHKKVRWHVNNCYRLDWLTFYRHIINKMAKYRNYEFRGIPLTLIRDKDGNCGEESHTIVLVIHKNIKTMAAFTYPHHTRPNSFLRWRIWSRILVPNQFCPGSVYI